jgi:hydroxymethylpyrimidine/phosphomethylpyrimidine kinase
MDLPLVVVDPVLGSKRGDPLLDADGVKMLCTELIPLARVVTPNIPEAEALSGVRIAGDEHVREAARRIHGMGAAAVIITGGHRPGGDDVTDLLFDGQRFSLFRTARVDSRNTHGTGCTFAAAVAAHLALGHELPEAAERSQQFVAGAIRHALPIGRGRGPLDHFWKLRL